MILATILRGLGSYRNWLAVALQDLMKKDLIVATSVYRGQTMVRAIIVPWLANCSWRLPGDIGLAVVPDHTPRHVAQPRSRSGRELRLGYSSLNCSCTEVVTIV